MTRSPTHSRTAAPPQPTRPDETTLSVGELNRLADRILGDSFGLLVVEGEVANLRKYPSGHLYFTLKDETAAVSCTLFRSHAQRSERFADGDRVRVHARPGIYAARGQFQLIVERVAAAGLGALLVAYERLREQLAAEGLFAPERKRLPPRFPQSLGVITSAQGDVRHDIERTLARRYPLLLPFRLYATAVQGAQAASGIVVAIEEANREACCDVLIIARGGGSIEDLWSFNDERVVRAIAGSAIPVIAGIGHETDTTLADFVADVRAPTPTGAAVAASPDQQELRTALTHSGVRLDRGIERQTTRHRREIQNITLRLDRQNPQRRLAQAAQRVDELGDRLQRALPALLAQRRAQLAQWAGRCAQQAPERTLRQLRERGAQARTRLHHALHARLRHSELTVHGLARRIESRHPRDRIAALRTRIHDARRRLEHNRERVIREELQRLAAFERRLTRARGDLANLLQARLHQQRQTLATLARSLDALAPERVLERGYAILFTADGSVVQHRRQAPIDSVLHAQIRDGRLRLRVEAHEALPGERASTESAPDTKSPI